MEPLISVKELSKLYPIGTPKSSKLSIMRDFLLPLVGSKPTYEDLYHSGETPKDMFWALKGVSFDVQEGDRIGIIGNNGAGKSTLLKILSRVTEPSYGEACLRGRVTALLEVGTGFNPLLTGRENIYLNASLHGLSKTDVDARLDDIIEFSELRRFIDSPLGGYSTGMRSRLAFSVAAHLDPDILVLDEVLAVGDMAFQQKCLERVQEMTGPLRTLLFVSHSMAAVTRYCERCIWMNEGRIVMDGPVEEVVAEYSSANLQLRSKIVTEGREHQKRPSKNQAEMTTDRGGPEAHLLSAKLSTVDGDESLLFGLNREVVVELTYERFTNNLIVPAMALYGSNNELIFWAVPPGKDEQAFRVREGCYMARVVIPANLLNVGKYFITLTAVSPQHTPMKRHFVVERALSFQMVESSDIHNESRGIMPRDFPGLLRPKLDWQHEELAQPLEANG